MSHNLRSGRDRLWSLVILSVRPCTFHHAAPPHVCALFLLKHLHLLSSCRSKEETGGLPRPTSTPGAPRNAGETEKRVLPPAPGVLSGDANRSALRLPLPALAPGQRSCARRVSGSALHPKSKVRASPGVAGRAARTVAQPRRRRLPECCLVGIPPQPGRKAVVFLLVERST